MMGFSCSWM